MEEGKPRGCKPQLPDTMPLGKSLCHPVASYLLFTLGTPLDKNIPPCAYGGHFTQLQDLEKTAVNYAIPSNLNGEC